MNKRLLIFGVDRFVFLGVLGIGATIFYSMSSLTTGAIVFMVLMSVARFLTKGDAQLPAVIFKLARLGRVFDSSLRQ